MGVMLDEIAEENRRNAEAGRDRPGFEGAAYRLLSQCDPNEVTAWLIAEAQRGTDKDDILAALANLIAFTLMTASGITPDAPHQAINNVLLRTGAVLIKIASGKAKMTVVSANSSGAEQMLTAEGMFKHGMPPLPKQEQ